MYSFMEALADAVRAAEPPEDLVRAMLDSKALGIRERDRKSRQPVAFAEADIVAAVEGCDHVREAIDRLRDLAAGRGAQDMLPGASISGDVHFQLS